MRTKLLLAFFSALVCFCQAAKNAKFELPGDIIPQSYLVNIATNFKLRSFSGKVEITVLCDINTRKVVLNVKDLKIDDKSVKIELLEEPDSKIEIDDSMKIEDEEKYVIQLSTDLIAGKSYKIHIPFERSFSSEFLAYQMKFFVDNGNNSKNYVAFTRLAVGYARGFFPCFDIMAYKAKFKIIHDHPADVIGFSNMILERSDTHELSSEKWVTDVFEETPPMSTHTIGLALAKLVEKTTKLDSEKSISIWSTELLQSRIDFASDMAVEILKFYAEYFEVDYPLKKLNILAMPFYMGNNEEETFGMIIGREDTIVMDENETDESKNAIVRKLCYTCGRQWIGGYSTMSQTNEYWIHQSLLFYLQGPCLEQTFPSRRSKYYDNFMFYMFMDVLENDLEKESTPLGNLYENVELTDNYPDSLMSEKTHLLVIMLKFIFGKGLFQKSLRNYVKSFAYKNSSLREIWAIFTKTAENEGILPPDVTVEQIMDSWMTKSMYPVIRVTRNYETNEVTILQEPFVMYKEERKTNPTEKCWLTPLSFTNEEENAMSDKVRGWSLCKENTVSLNNYYQSLSENSWILFNSKFYGLYRTDYDDRNWNLLQDALKNNKFGPMDELTRSRLLFDIFMLAKAGRRSYRFVLETLKYLIYEDSYFVWLVVEDKLKKIQRVLYRTEVYDGFQNYIGQILTDVFEKMDMDSINGLDQFHDTDNYDTKVKLIVFNLACNFGVKKCEEQSLLLFKKWCDNYDNEKETKLIPNEILQTVFCRAVKKNDENWQLLWEKYKLGNGDQVNNKILMGLGCSENKETLKGYSMKILIAERNESKLDDLVIFESLTLNKWSYGGMKQLLVKQHENFKTFFAGYQNANLDTGIEILLNATTRKFDLEEIKSLIEKVKNEVNYDTLMRENVVHAERHIEWFAKNKGTFSEFLSSKSVPDKNIKDDIHDGEDEFVEMEENKETDELDKTDVKE